jgi:hypothetical protein
MKLNIVPMLNFISHTLTYQLFIVLYRTLILFTYEGERPLSLIKLLYKIVNMMRKRNKTHGLYS